MATDFAYWQKPRVFCIVRLDTSTPCQLRSVYNCIPPAKHFKALLICTGIGPKLEMWQSVQALCAAGHQQPDAFKHIADEYRQIRADKTHAKLMDPAELPRRQKGVRRVDEGFWRQSTSHYAAPAAGKKRRKQTLERAPRKAARVAKPGRQVNFHIVCMHNLVRPSFARCCLWSLPGNMTVKCCCSQLPVG